MAVSTARICITISRAASAPSARRGDWSLTIRIDVTPLVTEIIPLAEADRAFELAIDRKRSMKVQLVSDG